MAVTKVVWWFSQLFRREKNNIIATRVDMTSPKKDLLLAEYEYFGILRENKTKIAKTKLIT